MDTSYVIYKPLVLTKGVLALSDTCNSICKSDFKGYDPGTDDDRGTELQHLQFLIARFNEPWKCAIAINHLPHHFNLPNLADIKRREEGERKKTCWTFFSDRHKWSVWVHRDAVLVSIGKHLTSNMTNGYCVL